MKQTPASRPCKQQATSRGTVLCYLTGVSAVGLSHWTFLVFVCQKYTRPWASFASDQFSGKAPAPAESKCTTRSVPNRKLLVASTLLRGHRSRNAGNVNG